jgi:hypothetical protein
MNLKSIRGDDVTYHLAFKDGDDAVDITGWKIYFTLKKNIDDDDDDALIKKETEPAGADAIAGLADIVLLDTDTNDLAGTYDYDIQYKDDSGLIKTVMKGAYLFEKDVTRRIT